MPASDECFKYLVSGDFERAIDCLTHAIVLDPDNAKAFVRRGFAKAKLCLYESAISDYDRAIVLDPNLALAFLNRGAEKAHLHQYESAISDYDRAIELDPNDALAFSNRGLAKASLLRYESAISDFDQAIELDPNNALGFLNRGVEKAHLRRYESALLDYDRAIELDPNDAKAFFSRGTAKDHLRRYESAISDFDRAIELDPNFALAFSNRGSAKGGLRHYESAISDYDRAIELDPNFAPTFYNRGNTKFNLRRYESAISDFDWAIELAPEMSLPYFGKALTLWQGSDELGAAHLHFNRFLFLAETEEIIEDWKAIHDFYTRHAAAPFLLHRLLELLPDIGDFLTWQGTFHETERQCRTLKKYLQYLHDAGMPERDALQFDHLETLVNYYMGDPMEAYRIYDEVIDSKLESINLMGQYYFIRSAMEFMEPYGNILDFALEQAEQFLENSLPGRDLRELYYAGQLFALKDDWEKALQAFQKAEALLPAAVMQVIAAENVGKSEEEIEMLTAKARKLALSLSEEENYLNGFPEVWLEIEREDFFAPFQQYAYFREISEHLYLIQEEETPFQHREFWEVWQLSPGDEEKIWWHYREKVLKKIEAELQDFFTRNLKERYAGYSEAQFKNLERLLQEKNRTVQAVFEMLSARSAAGSEALEHQLGLEIDTWQLKSAHAYSLLLKYFFLAGKLEPKATFLLYFYNDFTASRKQKDYITGKEAYSEGAQEFFKIILKPIWMLGDVALAGVAAAFAELTRQFLQQASPKLDEEDVLSDYQKFKAGFLKFLSFEMESMGREKFFQKYPLQGLEDWKK